MMKRELRTWAHTVTPFRFFERSDSGATRRSTDTELAPMDDEKLICAISRAKHEQEARGMVKRLLNMIGATALSTARGTPRAFLNPPPPVPHTCGDEGL